MKGEFMEEKKEGKARVNTRTESKLIKNLRRIFIIVASLGFLLLFYKMVASKLG
jgi:hypothetical protein